MHTIMVVDDDPIIIDGLCMLLKKIEPMSVVLVAKSGADALGVLLEQPVELILTDIKMPVMDGLELIENLRMLNFQGEVVIISGFDDFELVRKALQLGASDYLLKPVKSDELERVCKACFERLQSKRYRSLALDGQASTNNVHLQQVWLDKLMQGGQEAEQVRTRFTEFPTHLLCLVSDSLLSAQNNWNNLLISLADLIRSAVKDLSSPKPAIIHGDYSGYWIALIFVSSPESLALRKQLSEELSNRWIRCGLSKEFRSNEQQQAFWEAREMLKSNFYDMPTLEAVLPEPFPFEALTVKLLAYFEEENWREFYASVDELFINAHHSRPEPELLRQHLMTVVYNLMDRNKSLIGIIGRHKLSEKDIVLKVKEAMSFSILRLSFINILHQYMSELLDQRLAPEDDYILKAKSYIQKHFQNHISLSEIASELGLNPNYFSTLFHKKTNGTFTEYVRTVRIKNAITLMKEPGMQMREVAEQSGFSDNTQFYRAFKQVTGVSPGKFKRTHGGLSPEV